MSERRDTPIVMVKLDEWREYAGRTDVLVIAIGHDEVQLPQFDVVATLDGRTDADYDDAIGRALREMFAFHVALTELPPEYFNEVEAAQVELLADTVFPWIARLIANDPERMPLPHLPVSEDLVGA